LIFVADENIDTDIIDILRKNGVNIISIAEDFPSIPDMDVLKISNNHEAILITADKDFGELIFRRGEISEGVILLRIFGISQKQKARMILDVFKNHLTEFSGSFTVINKNKVRVKKMN
jgi:predicted nuclease of predicted toxin-antitoxin system